MWTKEKRVSLRRFHRWISVIIGLQLLFWVGTGTYFAWFPFKIIKGEDQKVEFESLPLLLSETVPVSSLVIPADSFIKSLSLESSPAGVVYRLLTRDDKRLVFDAKTGASLPMLEPTRVETLAKSQSKSEGAVTTVSLLLEPKDDYKGVVPVYKVALDDFRKTRLYVDPWTGKVLASRNAFWRLYDFFWMLHILDFKDREDFNNPIIRLLSVGSLVLIASGYLLFFYGRPSRRLNEKASRD